MENKKEKRKVSTKTLIAALLVLVLLLASVLGFTLARYFTQGEESQGGINIAQWDIDVTDSTTDEGAGTVTAMLSPAMEEYANINRTNAITNGGTALLFINNSDVDAEIELKITDGLSYYGNGGTFAVNYEINPETDIPQYDQETGANAQWQNVDLDDVISFAGDAAAGEGITVTYGTGDPETAAGEEVVVDTVTEVGTAIYKQKIAANGGWMKVTIGAITWTSDFNSSDAGGLNDGENIGDYGNLRDTWIGENVGSVGFAYSWSAVQGSQIPEAQQP